MSIFLNFWEFFFLAYSWQVLEVYTSKSFKCMINLEEAYQALPFRAQTLHLKKKDKKQMWFFQQETQPNPVKYRPGMSFLDALQRSCSRTFYQTPEVCQQAPLQNQLHQVAVKW